MTEPKPKSTVHERKGKAKASTQRFLPIAEIHNDTVLLKNGGLRAIIGIEALNFNLKSETEQQGIITGYGSFMNTLTFPLQIVVRSTRTNIDDYLDDVRVLANKHTNELLKSQTLNYVGFIQKLLEIADIMQKRFFVVIPVDRSARRKTTFEQFFGWLQPDDTLGQAAQRRREFSQGLRELNERTDLVESGLSNIGLHCTRLNTRDLVELFYQIYNPQTSKTEKLPQDLDALNLEKTTL